MLSNKTPFMINILITLISLVMIIDIITYALQQDSNHDQYSHHTNKSSHDPSILNYYIHALQKVSSHNHMSVFKILKKPDKPKHSLFLQDSTCTCYHGIAEQNRTFRN